MTKNKILNSILYTLSFIAHALLVLLILTFISLSLGETTEQSWTDIQDNEVYYKKTINYDGTVIIESDLGVVATGKNELLALRNHKEKHNNEIIGKSEYSRLKKAKYKKVFLTLLAILFIPVTIIVGYLIVERFSNLKNQQLTDELNQYKTKLFNLEHELKGLNFENNNRKEDENNE